MKPRCQVSRTNQFFIVGWILSLSIPELLIKSPFRKKQVKHVYWTIPNSYPTHAWLVNSQQIPNNSWWNLIFLLVSLREIPVLSTQNPNLHFWKWIYSSLIGITILIISYHILSYLVHLGPLQTWSQAVAGALPRRPWWRLRQAHVCVAQPQQQRRGQDTVVDKNTWAMESAQIWG